MKNRVIKIFSVLLCLLTVLSSLSLPAFALSWDGSSAGGGGGGTAAGPNGYAIRTDGDNVIGYRFSLVDKNGANKVSKVIDVFRNTSYGNSEYANAYKFNTKYNKKQLINNQNGSYSTSKNSTNCYLETSCGFVTGLPVPSGMGTWQNYTGNLNVVLSLLGAGNLSGLKNGDKILVEPIYDLRFQGVYHAVTVTETAIYGKHILGASSDGGSSWNSGSWGFISSYTNKTYPNQLYTPNGQGLWTGVSATSSRLTFYNMINQGWGVGIAYTETKPDFSPNLAINCCEAWPGAKSTRNSNHYGISYGSTFANWTYGHGYPYNGSTIWYAVNFPAESQNCYVRQYVWVDGGTPTSRNVYSNSNTWYDVALSPTTIPNNKGYIMIKAREDWIDGNGNVLKYGTEKSFYIPIKPIVTREQITAYAIDGSTQSYANASGTVGKMYFGQRVTFKYKYGGTNTWVSSNHLRGQSYRYDGSNWSLIYKSGAGEDVYVDYAQLGNGKTYTANSSVGTYTIPLNSNENANSYKMKFRFRTYWASDITNTGQETNYYLPIVKSDVELADIRFVDDDGYYVDKTQFEVGDHISVRYVYKNNTDCTVFVKGYNDDKSQIKGTFAVPANGTAEVVGYDFVVPNKRTFNVWGGVYLENVARGNTEYETNGENNTLTASCKSNHPVTLTPIAPNAPYRENTTVITSYYAENRATDNYTPDENLKVNFTVFKLDGTKIDTQTKSIIVPGKDKNLVYFAWRVPAGLNGNNVKIVAEIVDGDKTYNQRVNARSTTPYTYNQTPDTSFEKSAPSGFSQSVTPTATRGYTTWSEYSYKNRRFVKTNYGIGITSRHEITASVATGETATKTGNNWTMKSGYGVSVFDKCYMEGIEGYASPAYGVGYTTPQYAVATVPEYGYSTMSSKCVTLISKAIDGYVNWVFPKIGKVDNVHYTPIWYPDGTYPIAVIQSDAWTPMGMLSCVDVATNITINGNMYDDWSVGHK